MDLSQVSPGLWLAVLAANSLGGLLKENDRAGLPLFAVPALAAITLVEDAVVLMVFPSVGANLWLVMNHRRYHNLLREHLPFLVTGFIGGLSGTGLLVLVSVSDRGLKLLLVIWLGLYLIRYFSNRNSLKYLVPTGNLATRWAWPPERYRARPAYLHRSLHPTITPAGWRRKPMLLRWRSRFFYFPCRR